MNYKYTSIIIEPRKHKALEFVLNNMLECLSNDWKIVFFHGNNNIEYSTLIVNKLNLMFNNRIPAVNLNVDDLNQKTYSKLLATKSIVYDHINTEYFLVFQTDSMMFKRNINFMDFFIHGNYDYVGAPWLITNYQPTKDRSFIGNGGFSLRKTQTMLKIIENYPWNEESTNPIVFNEDLYFSKHYDNINILKPSYETAKQFCVDEVFTQFTMACHRPWCHDHFNKLVEIYPECGVLKDLQSVDI
jgi:hypothetical protein